MLAKLNRLRPIVAREWPILVAIGVMTVISASLAALQPLPIKLIVDSAAGGAPLPPWLQNIWDAAGIGATPMSIVGIAAVASLLLFAVSNLLDAAITWSWAIAGQRTVHTLSVTLFERLLARSPRYHQTHGVGDSLGRLGGDTWCLYAVTSQLLLPLEQIFVVGSISIVAWQLNPTLALMALGAAPPLAIASVVFGGRLKRRQQSTREAESRMLSFVHQTLSSIPVVQAFTTEDRNVARFRALASETAGLVRRRSLLAGAYGGVTGALSTAGSALVLFMGGRQVLAGTLSVGSLIVFFAYLQRLRKAVETLIGTYGAIKPIEASIDRVLDVLAADETEVQDRPGATTPAGRLTGRLTFEDVAFGYEAGRPVLRRIDVTIAAGETIGLVGATGAGKSTLLSLVPRFVDPWSGRVCIDDIDVRDVTVASLRAQIAVVLQESLVLPVSVADNIAYGRPGATRDDVVAAARAANAHAFIERLPEGYDTVLAERGASISGGERQRIAIARAFLKDAPLLLLDEPTSALDPLTEAAVLDALERLMDGRTTLVIAHRLSTIQRADRILVLDAGAIVEQGTHAELLALSGRYRELHARQTRQTTLGVSS
jgi:ATP-binding cassette subfamily B protein/subfamily B ATP-binding cassette protein MsbA